MKYTDEQIKKALECCTDGTGKGIIEAVLDLINRQEAEIDYWKRNAFDGCMERGRIAETARSEAIKEFAERLQKPILSQLGISTLVQKEAYYFCLDEIDNLVKEMVGEGE